MEFAAQFRGLGSACDLPLLIQAHPHNPRSQLHTTSFTSTVPSNTRFYQPNLTFTFIRDSTCSPVSSGVPRHHIKERARLRLAPAFPFVICTISH